ncbi:MAG: AmmeMemoRadiSam system radical SAM enzyme, partial [Candidatus Omnitrophota bacterium]
DFIKVVSGIGAGVCAFSFTRNFLSSKNAAALSLPGAVGYQREAQHYESMDEETVRCVLCPHECVLRNGQRGFCRVREPMGGKLYTLVYGLPCAVHVDPIEKKPVYHMLPGSRSFSIATAGCNLRCKFCQNWQISQSTPEETNNIILPPAAVVSEALRTGCKSIAYTYSEPTVFYEYMMDASRIAHEKGIKNVYVTAGYINSAPLAGLCSVIDAANVDLKAYDNEYLKKVCQETLNPLLDAIMLMRELGVWVELTNLIVPTLNDDPEMIRRMSAWIAENPGVDTPLHFSRFTPMYKLKDMPPTPLDTLVRARQIAMAEGLRYVYVGNVRETELNTTFCPGCGKPVVERTGYFVTDYHVSDGLCGYCGRRIAGVWQ